MEGGSCILFFIKLVSMKIKKKYIGQTLFVGRRRIQMDEVMDEKDFNYLKVHFPSFLEKEKVKKTKKEE